MFIHGITVEEIEASYKYQYQCRHAAKLGTGTYYFGNVPSSEDIMKLNFFPYEIAGNNNDTEFVLIPDKTAPNRKTYMIQYEIPEGYKIISVYQFVTAYHFNLNDDGKFLFVGREYPEIYDRRDNTVLELKLKADDMSIDNSIRVIRFIESEETNELIIQDEGFSGIAAKNKLDMWTRKRYLSTYINAVFNNRCRTKFSTKSSTIVFVNPNAAKRRKMNSYEYVNWNLRHGLNQYASVIEVSNLNNISMVLNALCPDSKKIPKSLMFFGYNFDDVMMTRNIIADMRNKAHSEEA